MKQQIAWGFLVSSLFVLFEVPGASAAETREVTFSRDVAPVLYQHCVSCHRPGEAAPMSLITFAEARPWAKSIARQVLNREMPPWHADPRYGRFANERRLSGEEIEVVRAWVDGGAKEGSPADLPAAPTFVEGWQIGEPDVVLAMPEEFPVPADGVLPYTNYRIATRFTEDKYIQAAEIRPGDRRVVHHCVVYVHDPDGGPLSWLDNWVVGYAPGRNFGAYPPGTAKLIKKGSVLIMNLHYTPMGVPTTDRTSVGFVFAKEPVEKIAITAIAGTRAIDIAPGDPNHEVRASFLFEKNSHIRGLNPHMHARGKDFLYTLVRPDGSSQVLLSVPEFDFAWQTGYRLEEPISAPAGSRLEAVAHFDNSANNPDNPDPTQRVGYGDQTWDEMMAGYVEFTVDEQNLLEERPTKGAETLGMVETPGGVSTR